MWHRAILSLVLCGCVGTAGGCFVGIQLKGAATPETEFYCDDPQLFCQYWNVESDSDSLLIDSPQGAIPTVSMSSNIISNGSIKSLATSKSNDTNETLGAKRGMVRLCDMSSGTLMNECPSDSDAVDRVVPEGIVEGVRQNLNSLFDRGVFSFHAGRFLLVSFLDTKEVMA